MTDENLASHTLELLKRMDAKLDRVIDEVGDLKLRVSSSERKLAELHGDVARLSSKSDQIDARLDRIERRLKLVPAPAE